LSDDEKKPKKVKSSEKSQSWRMTSVVFFWRVSGSAGPGSAAEESGGGERECAASETGCGGGLESGTGAAEESGGGPERGTGADHLQNPCAEATFPWEAIFPTLGVLPWRATCAPWAAPVETAASAGSSAPGQGPP